MKCIDCGAETRVLQSVTVPPHGVRRRRECPACSTRFTTWETTTRPAAVRPGKPANPEARTARQARKKAKLQQWRQENPEAAKAASQRHYLRRQARAMAKDEGVEPEVVYRRLGVM